MSGPKTSSLGCFFVLDEDLITSKKKGDKILSHGCPYSICSCRPRICIFEQPASHLKPLFLEVFRAPKPPVCRNARKWQKGSLQNLRSPGLFKWAFFAHFWPGPNVLNLFFLKFLVKHDDIFIVFRALKPPLRRVLAPSMTT